MKLVARIIVAIGALWFLAVFVGEAVNRNPGPFTWEGATVVAIGIVAIAAAILSWRRESLAAIVMLALSVAIGIHIAICAGRYHLLAWTAMGLPYLVAGLLLRGSLRLSRDDEDSDNS